MKKKILLNGTVFAIIFLFVGSSVVFAVSGYIEKIGDIDDFDNYIEGLMEYGYMPSLVACIVKNNTVVWSKGYGYSCYYREKDATVDTVYPVASVTKSITATAIMQLNETGLIGLDDNVSEYLSFDLKNPKYPNINITFRMLLAHQSSLADTIIRYSIFTKFLFLIPSYDWLDEYFLPGGSLYNSKVWNNYPPGGNVCYSTVGTEILGYLLEQVTHQSYVDYCQEHIFEPLKMRNTSFYFSDFDKDKLACLYFWIVGFYLPIPRIQANWHAGGGLKTTISDLSHFLIMHTSGGVYEDVRILKEESVEEMHRVQYCCYAGSVLHGLGWYLKTFPDGETYGGHGGYHQGARAEMKMRYSDKVGVLYFWNQNTHFLIKYGHVRPNEWEAQKEIEKALFEKADEL